MLRTIFLSVFVFLHCFIANATEKEPDEKPSLSQGVMVGGMLSENESFLMGKYEYLINNVGLQIVMSREAFSRQIDYDASLDKYRRTGYGLTFRYYVPDVLKGFYGGAALSSTTASLATTFSHQEERQDSFLNLGGIEVGYRVGGNRKGFTGEIGFRRMYTFNQLQLATSQAIDFSDVGDGVSSHAWNLEAGDHFDKFFVGLGFIF